MLTLVLGHPYVAFLRRAGLGKQVRGESPSSHLLKTGTPTLSRLLSTSTVLALTRMLALTVYRDTGCSILLPASVMLSTALLGADADKLSLDDRGMASNAVECVEAELIEYASFEKPSRAVMR